TLDTCPITSTSNRTSLQLAPATGVTEPKLKKEPQHAPIPGFWQGQGMHLFGVVALTALVLTAWNNFDRPFPVFFWLAVAVPIAHQVFVWVVWRTRLHASSANETIGLGFYVTCFFLLFGGRFVTLTLLAWFDSGSLNLPRSPRVLLTSGLLAIGLYAMYSVKRYFGMKRAAGADHFDPKYREMPLVKGGIFSFTSNGMYLYAFFLFWAIAVGFDSLAALIVAAFSHVYIWLHFFVTEKPDMAYLYGAVKEDGSN
ncbi:MAG: methyltransferase, partial [bacterium]